MAEVLRSQGCTSIWRVVALETPCVWRHCSACGASRRFRSSERFRVNAQQRKLDVWLIYRCAACATAWNCAVVSRRTPGEIGADLLSRFERNDVALAWACAFDRAILARAGARPERDVAFRVDEISTVADEAQSASRLARLELAHPLEVRLDRVLAAALGTSRSHIERLVRDGTLNVFPVEDDALRRPARDGQCFELRMRKSG